MNKNLKRLFVTTAIITSLANTNDAHATGVVRQLWSAVENWTRVTNPVAKKQELKEVMEVLEERQGWVNGLDDMTDSIDFFRN